MPANDIPVLQKQSLSTALTRRLVHAHGHWRTTAYVDVLMRQEYLTRFKDCWIGRGWLDLFEGSKGFKDTWNGVKVDVI